MTQSNRNRYNCRKCYSFAAYLFFSKVKILCTFLNILSTGLVYPNTYVSYRLEESSPWMVTPTISNNSSPVWRSNQQISTEISQLSEKLLTLIFHVWHQKHDIQDIERDMLLGTAKVDFTTLISGLPELHGWYHIMDYSKQKLGQLKVRIVPEKPLSLPSKLLSTVDLIRLRNRQYHNSEISLLT